MVQHIRYFDTGQILARNPKNFDVQTDFSGVFAVFRLFWGLCDGLDV
jgi:hypothetical protein